MAAMNNINFSILDFGLRDSTMGALRIQLDLFKYAQHADALGFKRFWLAEHYYTNRRLAWTNPEPLITLIAAHTDRIKVGGSRYPVGYPPTLPRSGVLQTTQQPVPQPH